ncbi:MAG: Rieske (2Fe-2S) protein [Burkholderiaceae bacterium]
MNGTDDGTDDGGRPWLEVCASQALADGGDGVRFEWPDPRRGGAPMAAFAVRHRGRVYAFLNRCAHVPVELDWQPGKFFDDSGLYLICATHGAVYQPASGRCIAGPCRGAHLYALNCDEHDGMVRVQI